ncbi:MAG: hypothetical protein JXR69_07995 [Candidatus Delongbacteria bacterium]|nr:hypothetical protein [Candidatus Delongbacteria bacterium]
MANKRDQYRILYHKSLFNTVFVFLSVKGKYDSKELKGLSGEIMIANSDRDNKFSILKKTKFNCDEDLKIIFKNTYSDMFEQLKEIAQSEIEMFYLNKYYKKGFEKTDDVDLRFKFILDGISLYELDFAKAYIYLPNKSIEKFFKDSQSEELKEFIRIVYKHKKLIVEKK